MALISADGKTTMTLSVTNNFNVKFHNGKGIEIKMGVEDNGIKAGLDNNTIVVDVNEISNEDNKIDTLYSI